MPRLSAVGIPVLQGGEDVKFGVFKIVPAVVRDNFYRILARNRYTLFGKRATCTMPKKEVRDSFLT